MSDERFSPAKAHQTFFSSGTERFSFSRQLNKSNAETKAFSSKKKGVMEGFYGFVVKYILQQIREI